MKKIILLSSLVMASMAMNAQTEQDPAAKKKDDKKPNTTQDRSINQKGVSVKSRSLSKKSPSSTTKTAEVSPAVKEETKKTEKKPE